VPFSDENVKVGGTVFVVPSRRIWKSKRKTGVVVQGSSRQAEGWAEPMGPSASIAHVPHLQCAPRKGKARITCTHTYCKSGRGAVERVLLVRTRGIGSSGILHMPPSASSTFPFLSFYSALVCDSTGTGSSTLQIASSTISGYDHPGKVPRLPPCPSFSPATKSTKVLPDSNDWTAKTQAKKPEP